MAADRRQGNVAKEEPQVLWQDRDIAVLSKGAGWIVAISREIEQNKLLSGLLRSAGTRDVRDLVNSGKYEHLCHYVNLKFREDKDYVLATSNEHEFGLAHRLDVDTSGALMLGKSLQGFHHLRQAFTSHQVFKEYICLVHGAVKKSTDQVNLPIAWDEHSNVSSISDQGMWAKSIYTVLGRYRVKGGKKVFTLCRVVIITGRTHQIRIHMAAIGHPLVGDGKYNKRHAQTDFMWCPRLFLHAWRIGFWDCWGAWHEVKAPLPRDVSRSLKTLEAIQLDLDNSGNPSCRILTATLPSRETTTPVVSGQTGFKEASPTPLPKPPPPPPKALSNADVNDHASRLQEPLSGPAHGKHGLGGPMVRVFEGPQPPLLPPASVTDYEASPAVHVDLPSSGPFHLPCSPPPPPPKRQGGGDLEHVALAGNPKEPATAGIRAEGEDSAGRQSRADAGCRRSPTSGKDQAHLEELCCEVAKRTLLDLPMHQCSVGQLGCMREVAPVLQQMGFRRPTLSKILRDRPETFEVVGEVNSEQIVTLNSGARAREQMGVPLASCSSVSDSNVRPGSFEELQQMDVGSLRSRSEDWPTPALARRPAVAPWCIDYQSYEEPCATLVEMGFERQSALRALQVNHGNLMEAMDQLSSQPVPALEKPAAERSRSSKLSQEPLKASLASQASQDGSSSTGKWAAAATQSEEELLHRALVLSQREEEDRQRRQEMDESALAAALADSLRPGSRLPTAEEDDLQLKEALRQSRQLEDDVRRQALLEEEEVECAIRESMQNYELFHACGSDALEETLKHSLEECSAEELEWQASWEAIQTAYNESSGGPEDDLARFVAVEQGNDSAFKAWDEGEVRGSGLWFPPTANSLCAPLGSEGVADVLDVLDAGIQGPRSTEAPDPAASLDLHTWLLRRVQELEVELDGHVLWTLVNELEETLLGDDDVLKMWLGFMAEEPLPLNIKRLLTDFKQRKESLRLQAD